jgi:hypothetical protein
MKRTAKILTWAVAVAIGISAPISAVGADARESQILERERAFESAWNKRDPQAMGCLITDDFVIITRTLRFVDRKAFLAGLKAGDFSVNERDQGPSPKDLLIRFYGPATAVVTFSDEEPWGVAGGRQVPTLHRFTHVWVNPDGKGWRMASRHVSLPPARPQ